MPKRVQSPSSINIYKQCPRRYFYQYVLKYPTKENIHTVRGGIVHSALENFFSINPGSLDPEYYKRQMSTHLKNEFDKHWVAASQRIRKLGLDEESINHYYNDSTQMLANWITHFFNDLSREMKNKSLSQAFETLKPIALEKEYKDPELSVRGFIDVIHKEGEDIILMDYKTSKSSDLKDEYMLQLGIYAMLYEKAHGVLPKEVGLWFLKDKAYKIPVTRDMVKNALFEVEQIHFATESDRICDYPKKESGLCKFSSGQCDFYDVCVKQR